MPRNAIATGLVDYVLPVAEIPGGSSATATGQPPAGASAPGESAHADDDDALREIFALVSRARTGHDFSNYKRGDRAAPRRRRMSLHELADLAAYAGFVRNIRTSRGC